MKARHSTNKNPECIARAIILNRGKILLCSGVGTGRYFLPGGHVEMFETSADALKRELKEELGIIIRAQTLVGVMENMYHDGKRKRHEINLVYSARPLRHRSRSMEDGLDFFWMPVSKLDKIPALPKSLFRAVMKWAKNKKYFVVYQKQHRK